MNLDKISTGASKALALVRRHHDLCRVAEELQVSKAAITMLLQRAEASSGVKLIDRRKRPFALTRYGNIMADHGERILLSRTMVESELAALSVT